MFRSQNMSWHSNCKAIINREYQLIEKALIRQDIENNKILQEILVKEILYTIEESSTSSPQRKIGKREENI